ncbi:helix-turn-helix domain-containing protein [Paenibacillus sp. FSL R5-808]|jgi:transcriptional regulator with XRE-family HTH domain|uniref:helix-turn-helix domain-containing protein n=1 Tax=Paenibacillus sp. FSL R5-808 TaxID=1227076 RepID=UPI0003E1C921|nr:helix-turn-helix domain-containing protein [Paenibacillus sp. FSL R5-808]ETT38503.1 XRE family transcriptional regulator [Paenibacillus sp. FSL R5-808]
MLEFGIWLRNNRSKLGISARSLAASCDVSPSYISQVERGHIQKPSFEVAQKVMTAFQIEEPETILRQFGYLDGGDITISPNMLDSKRTELLAHLTRELERMDLEQLEALNMFYKYQDIFIKLYGIDKASIDLNTKIPMKTTIELIEFLFEKYVIKRKRNDEPVDDTDADTIKKTDNKKQSTLEIEYYEIPKQTLKTINLTNKNEY